MNSSSPYPIGIPGKAWTEEHHRLWLDEQVIKRSYRDLVVDPICTLAKNFEVDRYGQLSHDSGRYPLLGLRSRGWDERLPTALISGGVHGYETSGVLGALRFLQTSALDYARRVNLLVVPCISPWSFETINRWNPRALDPNRNFEPDSPVEESASLFQYISELGENFDLHIDLHETTDTDATEYRPAQCARDGKAAPPWEEIPDGFYLVGDAHNPQPDFQRAIVERVATVTHIAEPDGNGNIIGEPLQQHGVINYAVKPLKLCAGITDAPLTTTTEVYPDSSRVDVENCIDAQVTAVEAALDHLRASMKI